MTRTIPMLLACLLLLTVAASAKRRDPLTEAEADQIRETALEPQKRLQLFIRFAEARLTYIDEDRANPKMAGGRGKRVHDLLEDFTAILDEINDNLDQYQGHPLDKDDKKLFRKGLKEVMDAGSKWQVRLDALQAAAETDPQFKKEFADYRYVLQDAQDALKSSIDMAREYSETKDKEPDAPRKK